MMKESNNIKTREMTYIAAGIAALISGGVVIYQISSFFVIPGMKYILMAPYLSMIMYILSSKIRLEHSLLWIGTVFGCIMVAMNLFMTISIVTTAVLTEISIWPIRKLESRCFVGSILFSGYAGLAALLISKYFIGGVFDIITPNGIAITTTICLIFGYAGAKLGQKIQSFMR